MVQTIFLGVLGYLRSNWAYVNLFWKLLNLYPSICVEISYMACNYFHTQSVTLDSTPYNSDIYELNKYLLRASVKEINPQFLPPWHTYLVSIDCNWFLHGHSDELKCHSIFQQFCLLPLPHNKLWATNQIPVNEKTEMVNRLPQLEQTARNQGRKRVKVLKYSAISDGLWVK